MKNLTTTDAREHDGKEFARFGLEEAEHLDLEAIEADIRLARNTVALRIEESEDETQARIRSAATTLTAMLKQLPKPYPIAVS